MVESGNHTAQQKIAMIEIVNKDREQGMIGQGIYTALVAIIAQGEDECMAEVDDIVERLDLAREDVVGAITWLWDMNWVAWRDMDGSIYNNPEDE